MAYRTEKRLVTATQRRRAGVRKSKAEHNIQAAFIQWCRWMGNGRYPELKNVFAIPNAGMRSPTAVWYHKEEGLEKGVLDVFVAVARADWPGLWIEFKDGANCMTKEQKEWSLRLREQGYLVCECRSALAAQELTEFYVNLPPFRHVPIHVIEENHRRQILSLTREQREFLPQAQEPELPESTLDTLRALPLAEILFECLRDAWQARRGIDLESSQSSDTSECEPCLPHPAQDGKESQQ